MPTIESLVLSIGSDVTGLKRGLAESNAAISGFVKQANLELQGISKSDSSALTGYRFATDLLNGLQQKFNQDKGILKEQFARGLFDDATYRERGLQTAQAFNTALLSGLAEIRGRAALPAEVELQLQNSLKDDGFKAGDAFVKAAQAQMAKIRPPDDSPLKKFAQSTGVVGALVDETSGRFTSLGRSGATALRSLEFGLGEVASASGGAEGALRGALRGVSTFSEAFAGPAGLLVPAISAAGLALFSFWSKQREEAAATAKALQTDLANLYNASNITALQSRAQELFKGRPSVNAGIEQAPSGKDKDAGLIVKGGLADLQRQLREAQAEFDRLVPDRGIVLLNRQQRLAADLIKNLQAQIAPIQAAYLDVSRAITNPTAIIGTAGSLGNVTVRASNPAKAAVKELKDSRAELSALTATIGEEGLAAFKQTGFGERLAADYRDALDLLRRQPDQLGPDALGLRRLLDQNADAITKALGGPGKPVQSTLQLLPAAGAPTVAIAPAATESVNRYVTAFGKLNPTLHNLQLGADAVRDISDAFGQGGRQVAEYASEVSGLVDSIMTLQSGNLSSFTGALRGLTGIAGIVGTLGSLGAGLFGKSPAEKARDAAIENNTQALERVRGSLDRSFSSGTNLDATRAAIAAYLSPSNAGLRKTLEQDAGKSVHADTELGKFLAAFHLTSDQLVALASSYGITIFQNGKVVTDALKDLGDAIAATSTSLTTFGTDFAGQDAAKQLRDKLFGKTNATDTLSRELEELAQFAPSLGKAFQGLDTTTEAGRAQIRTALQQLYLEIQNGALSLADLGSFTSIADLLSVIGGTSDALDALSTAANDVSGALRNVPQGFKVAAATFAATDAQIRALIPPPSRTYPTPLPTDPTFGQLQPAAFTFASGAIVIQGASKSADQLLDEIALAAQRRAAGYGGTYTPADMFALGGAGAARSAV